MGRLDGKVAFITGTGGQQGRAAARLFAREGAKVVGCDVNSDPADETLNLVRAAGGQMVSMAPVDISTIDGAHRWATEGVKAFGGIDILYNNASRPKMGTFAKMPPEDWDFTIQNELNIVYYVTFAAWPYLVERGGGSIISTSSVAAVRGVPGFEQSAHAAAKAGVMGLTTALVSEGGRHRIRVNTITPGPIRHPLIEPWLKDPENPFTRMVARIPIGRIGEPEDVAKLALFLASDESSFITGANIVIDGGLSSFM